MAKKESIKKIDNDDFKIISENHPFWNFEEKSTFIGKFVQQLTLGDEQPFKVNKVIEEETGKIFFLTNAYAIEKCIATVKGEHSDLSNVIFKFEFKGKTVNKNNQPFNQFDTAYKISN